MESALLPPLLLLLRQVAARGRDQAGSGMDGSLRPDRGVLLP